MDRMGRALLDGRGLVARRLQCVGDGEGLAEVPTGELGFASVFTSCLEVNCEYVVRAELEGCYDGCDGDAAGARGGIARRRRGVRVEVLLFVVGVVEFTEAGDGFGERRQLRKVNGQSP